MPDNDSIGKTTASPTRRSQVNIALSPAKLAELHDATAAATERLGRLVTATELARLAAHEADYRAVAKRVAAFDRTGMSGQPRPFPAPARDDGFTADVLHEVLRSIARLEAKLDAAFDAAASTAGQDTGLAQRVLAIRGAVQDGLDSFIVLLEEAAAPRRKRTVAGACTG